MQENGADPINIFHAEYKTTDTPIRLSYHDGNHYNAVVNPLIPTAGLGLGLPGLEPGLADRLQVEKAKEESEIEIVAEESHKAEVNRVLKESGRSADMMYKKKAMAMSDLEATDFELEQAVLRSSLESYRTAELGRKQPGRRRAGGNSISPVVNNSDDRFVAARHSSAMPFISSSSSSTAVRTERIPEAVDRAGASLAAVAAPAAAAAAGPADADVNDRGERDEYPQIVQEMVMNGFDLHRVLRAYNLVGDNFDALLATLMHR